MLKLELEYIDPQAKQPVEPQPITQPIPLKLIKLPAGFGCAEFYLAETPITEAQWCAVMGGETTRPDYPKVRVSYYDAREFCCKAYKRYGVDFRLPTEFEWCRAVGVEPEPTCMSKYAVFGCDEICEVKTKLPNEFGLYDMRGLVWEWLDGQAVDDYGVVRGGSWSYDANYCRSASRGGIRPANDYDDIGFRVAVSRPYNK
jgi:formylglycine-generating enzyme required for sulfatase activity